MVPPEERVLWKGRSVTFGRFSHLPAWVPGLMWAVLMIQPVTAYGKGFVKTAGLIKGGALIAVMLLVPWGLLNLFLLKGAGTFLLTDRRLLIKRDGQIRDIALGDVIRLEVLPMKSQLSMELEKVNARLRESLDSVSPENRAENAGRISNAAQTGKLTRAQGYVLYITTPEGEEAVDVYRPDLAAGLIEKQRTA